MKKKTLAKWFLSVKQKNFPPVIQVALHWVLCGGDLQVRELEIRAVLTRGFEPPRVTPCAPEAHASASSAT
jgi:hypothetical protein